MKNEVEKLKKKVLDTENEIKNKEYEIQSIRKIHTIEIENTRRSLESEIGKSKILKESIEQVIDENKSLIE